MIRFVGAICDRCYKPYLAPGFPHVCLCPGCFLGILPAHLVPKLARQVERIGRGI